MSDPALGIEFWQQIGVAAFCGGLIGLERQLHGKPMGIRTGLLICVATSLFVSVGADLASPQGDPSRVVGQVVTGIGFLGAGVIFSRDNVVSGLTTAALIWFLAAVGCLAGLGYVATPLLVTAAAATAVFGLERLERLLPPLRKGAHSAPKKPPLG